jgi:hypothetical protein
VRIYLAAFFSFTLKAYPVPDPVPPLSPYAWQDMTVSQIFLGQSRCGIMHCIQYSVRLTLNQREEEYIFPV